MDGRQRTFLISRMRRPVFAGPVLALFLFGCSHYGPTARAPSRGETTGGPPAAIGIAHARFLPKVGLDTYAKGRLAGAARGAGEGFLKWSGGFASGLGPAGGSCSGEGCAVAALVILGMIAAAGTVGAIVGGVKGAAKAYPAGEAGKIEDAARRAFSELRLQEKLAESAFLAGRKTAPGRFVLLGALGPDSPDGEADYGALSREGIGTVLEVEILEMGFMGDKGDRAVRLFVRMRGRLVRAVDGAVIFNEAVRRQSEGRSLAAWEAEGSRLYHLWMDRTFSDLGRWFAGRALNDHARQSAP